MLTGPAAAKKRRQIVSPVSSSSSDSSSGSDDPDGSDGELSEPARKTARTRKEKGKLWNGEQLRNIRKNYPAVEHLDDSVPAYLGFKEIAAMAHKRDRSNKALSEKLAENYEKLRKFPVWVEAGHDQCTGTAHKARVRG